MANGRMYSAPIMSKSLAAADDDIFEMGTNSTTVALLHEVRIESALTTDERLHWVLRRATTGGNGTDDNIEAELLGGNTVASGVTFKYMAGTPGTDGDSLLAGCWSQLAPLHLLWTPETRITIPVSSFLVLNCVTAPGAARTISGYVIWEEFP